MDAEQEKRFRFRARLEAEAQQGGPEFDPAPAEPAANSEHGASGTWGSPRGETPSMTEALLPAFSAARKGGSKTIADLVAERPASAPGGFGRQALGLGSDIISGALRLPAAVGRMADTHIGTSGDHPQGFRESLGQINRGQDPVGNENFITNAVKDPATLPSLAMGGPTGGIAKTALFGLKSGLMSAGLHQGDRIARGQGADLGDAALETGINTVAPVAFKGAGAALKGSISGIKTILSKFSGVDEGALKTAAGSPEALQAAKAVTQRTGGDLSNMADDLGRKTSGMQADEAQAIDAVNARRKQTLQGGMLRARLGAPNSKLSDVSAYEAGKRIETAAKTGMQSAGERFGRGQDEILVNRGIGGKGVEFGGVSGDQNAFEQTVDKYLDDAGVGQGGKSYGVIGNVSIPAGAINEIRALKDTFKTALTTRDMLDQLRLVDNRLSFGGEAGGRLFAPGSQEDLAMKGLRSRLADDLENQIARAAGKEKNAVLSAWNAHREAYHKTASAFEQIQEGIGAGRVNQETYFNRIKNIGIDELRKIAVEAKKNPDLAGTWNELRKGFFDNVIASGIKEDGIDYSAIKKVWDAMDDDLKTTMMPTKVISHVDGVLDRTKPLDFKGSTLTDNNRWMGRDRQSTLGALENIGNKAKRTDLEDLKTLDDLLGLEGKDRFSEQASGFYLGKQLGMTPKGNLPLFTSSPNGAKVAGAVLGGTLGGAMGGSQEGVTGGSLGGGLGVLAGVALQSPAGALAAYKILNQIRKGVIVGERNIARPLAQHGLSSGRLTRAITTQRYGGD